MYFVVLMGMMSILCFAFGISYFKRENAVGAIRYSIFLLGLTAGLHILGYTMMSISEADGVRFFWRTIGFFGICFYLYLEACMVFWQLELGKKIKYIFLIIDALLLIIDIIAYPFRNDIVFEKLNGITIYKNIETPLHYVHYVYSGFIIVQLLIFACFWMKQQKNKRGKVFVLLCYISNFMYMLSSFPYYLRIEIKIPQLPYTIGTFVAYFVLWYGGIKLSGFSVTKQYLGKDIMDTINVPLLVLNAEGELILHNPTARKDFHLPRAFEIATLKLTLDRLFDISKENVARMMEEILKKGQCVYPLRSSDKERSYSVHCMVKKDYWNEPICIICVASDTTREEQMIAEVLEANAAKSDFLANMSHEIRTPINVILGMNEMVLREAKSENVIEYSENIQHSGQALLSIVNDILDFSKIESGKFEIVEGKYSVASLVSDSVNMVYIRAEKKKQKLILKCDPSIPSELYGDEIRLRQIFTNLLTNAVKYTPEEGEIIFDISASEADGLGKTILKVSVSDNGIGIKEENISQLFVSFQRLEQKRNRNIEGTGLGLPITKNIVEEMNGTIEVKSVYGEGSTFTVNIPQRIANSTPVGKLSDKSKSVYKQDVYQSVLRAPEAKILVVDDMEMNLNVFAGLLKPSKIFVDKCISGKKALERIYEMKYDLIFMDHMMPEMDGIETFQEIRRREDHKNLDTPIIMLSANAIAGVKEQYLSYGFSDYLSKPIQSELLENMIIKHLNPDKIEKVNEVLDKESVQKASDSVLERLSFLDVKTGLMYCANEESLYLEIIEEYINSDRRELLENSFIAKDLGNYGVYAHALKSASLTIGALELSAQARLLEEAAKRGDMKCVEDNHWLLIAEYKKLLEQLIQCLHPDN